MDSTALLKGFLLILLLLGVKSDVTFNFENQCSYSVWLASNPGIGDAMPERPTGTIEIFDMSEPWAGSIWARTKCSNNDTEYFSCETGDCGTGEEVCETQPVYPVTMLNINISNGMVSYEVSINHGFTVPIRIEPDGGSLGEGGSGKCPVVDCIADLSNVCPADLVANNSAGAYVGCYSACDQFQDPKFCCTGEYSSPQACQPNQYSKTFKQLCGLAHTYPGDNQPPIYKCKGANSYNVTFCPV